MQNGKIRLKKVNFILWMNLICAKATGCPNQLFLPALSEKVQSTFSAVISVKTPFSFLSKSDP